MKAAAVAIDSLRPLAVPGPRASFLASFLGGLLKLFAPRLKLIEENLLRVYPDSTPEWRKALRKRLYEHLGWLVTEVLALQRDPSQAFEWIDEVRGIEFVEETLDAGKGMLFLSGHYGNWELIASWYAQFLRARDSRDFYIVSQRLHDADVSRLLARYRENVGISLLPKETSVLEMVRLLKSGANIALLADISWIDGVELPFMGHPCSNTTGPAVLSMLASVPIVPVALYRKGPFRHTAQFFPPLPTPQGGDRRARIEQLTLSVNDALEKMIKRQPELWFWLHNRWK